MGGLDRAKEARDSLEHVLEYEPGDADLHALAATYYCATAASVRPPSASPCRQANRCKGAEAVRVFASLPLVFLRL
jgi:hypothetical protein